MQLVTYGAIACELEKRRMAQLGRSGGIHVGGLLYYTFDNPACDVTAMGDKIRYTDDGMGFAADDEVFGGVLVDTFEKKILEESRYSGLYNGDNRALKVMDNSSATLKNGQSLEETLITDLMEANRRNIERLAGSIAEGSIEINPVNEGKANACKYCDFKGICAFDSKYSGNSYSRIYRGEAENYSRKAEDIKNIKTEYKKVRGDMEKAVKSCDSARKKYEDAKKKVDDRGDKATQKMRDTLESTGRKLAEERAHLEELRELSEQIVKRAAEFDIEMSEE